ncbi:MAG: Lpg1974 family pore-forming outer membrane protein, partial [Aeoliella sp.]
PVAIVDPGYEPGFRVGGGYAWSCVSELMGTYTRYESDASSSLMVAPPSPNVILPLVFHPATLAAGSVFTTASARSNVTLNMVDIDYRRTLADNWLRTSYFVGGRYVNMDQSFSARFTGGVAPGPSMQNVATQVDFNGGGIRMGLTADLATPQSGFFGYANGFASFIAGEFQSSFRQTDGAAMPIVVATTSRTDDRVVPILDIELGVGWQSQSGAWRFTAGYLFSAWFNVVSTDEFIRAAHTAQFGSLSDTLTFDGLSTRVDWRF